MDTQPLVSIGVPVYNGERHLRETLESLLAQTMTDFELIISDNASTDGTEAICREYADRDPRIRYHRQPKNLGAPENWNFVVRVANGRYFKWSSASDSCTPNFLEACVSTLEQDPEVVVCFGRTNYVDEDGRPVELPDGDVEAIEENPIDRYRRVCAYLAVNNEQYGLIRRDMLMKTRLDRDYPHGDLVLMAELVLFGKFKRHDEALLIRRAGEREWTGMMSAEDLDSIFWPDASPRFRADIVRRFLDYNGIAFCCSIPVGDRIRVMLHSLRMTWWKRRKLGADLANLFGNNRAAGSASAE